MRVNPRKTKEGIAMTNQTRYCSVEQSIIASCKQVKAMRSGKAPKRSWKDCKKEIQKMKEEVNK